MSNTSTKNMYAQEITFNFVTVLRYLDEYIKSVKYKATCQQEQYTVKLNPTSTIDLLILDFYEIDDTLCFSVNYDMLYSKIQINHLNHLTDLELSDYETNYILDIASQFMCDPKVNLKTTMELIDRLENSLSGVLDIIKRLGIYYSGSQINNIHNLIKDTSKLKTKIVLDLTNIDKYEETIL